MRRSGAYTLAALALTCIIATIWAGHELTKPAQQSTGPPPLNARPLELPSTTGETVSAWFIPGLAGRGAVLMLHPVRSNKRTMLARTRFLQQAGYSVLLVDLQAHGESSGKRIGFGALEAAGVHAATQMLRRELPAEKLAVLGVSLGAAAFVLADVRGAYAAVILESLYPTIEEALTNRLRIRFGTFGELLAPLLRVQIAPWIGVPASRLRPIDRMKDLGAPVLIVHGAEDRHTPPAEAERIYAAASEPKDLYTVPGAGHVDLYAHAGKEYEHRILTFLQRHMANRH